MFQNDLKFGNFYENKLISDLKLENVTMAPSKKFYDWDIMANNITYEVKTDRYTSRTGNFCIEFRCNNNPSGISTSKADYYAYYVTPNLKGAKDELYLIPTNDLKQIIKNNNFQVRNLGDNKKSECYLIPKSFFSSYIYNVL